VHRRRDDVNSTEGGALDSVALMKRALLGIVVSVALTCACSKKVASSDCLSWQQHFEEIAAVVDQRMDTCKADATDVWKSSLEYRRSSTKAVCEHLDGRRVPKPEDAQCYLQGKTSAAVKACNIAEGSALDEFVWAAASLDPTADSLCAAK
jgi:hypothetical protein